MALIRENDRLQSFILAVREGNIEQAYDTLPSRSQIICRSYETCQCLDDYLQESRVLEIVPGTGFTLLHRIIYYEESPAVAWMLITNEASLITHLKSPAIPYDRTVLHEAAYMNYLDLVERILQQTRILDYVLDQPTIGTPLISALDDEFIEDITVDERNQILRDNEKTIMYLLQYRQCAVSARICNLSLLLESKRDADIKERFTKKWIQQSYPVEHEDYNTWPPLVTASTHCYVGIIKALLQHGANPNTPDREYHVRPLGHLCNSICEDDGQLVEAARLLVEAGADPSDVEKSEEKRTVLDIILDKGRQDLESSKIAYVKLVGFFLNERGMDANSEDANGRTLFARAIDRGSVALANEIYKSGGGPKLDEFKKTISWTRKKSRGAAEFIQDKENSSTVPQGPWADCTLGQRAEFVIKLMGKYPELLDIFGPWYE
uniref:WGS project CBMG000000000 data, contig CS5907-c003896 n=1 Tax=Fusarium acuminatum CS5907 TaxID=1318461 RepID=A0A090MEC0_9HYPO|nr:unnamed protein product [Fusarium acuminatum CS5907]